MHRLLPCLLISFVLCLTFPALAEKATEIRTVQELEAIRDNPSGDYVLMANIDLEGVDWTPFAFSGTLNGNGCTLYNLHVTREGEEHRVTRDGNLIEYDTTFAGLFSVMEQATVTGVHFLGAHVEIENESHCYAGVLAGYMDHSTISDCSIDGRISMASYGKNAGIGGLIGYGCGTFSGCSATIEMVYEDRYSAGRCEMFMGGLLGCGVVDLIENTVVIDGYDSCRGYVHNGGLVGMYYQCGMDYPRGEMARNTVTGRIIFFEDNPDRRSYVRAFIGEPLQTPAREYGNRDSFRRPVVWDYSKVLSPEACDVPDYVDTLEAPGEATWGYALHTCSVCGYAWKDHYTEPGTVVISAPEENVTKLHITLP
ncbi:MAG: hypothetical protein IJ708_17300 [Clostridia bacterium]|nr:hypothetical protein [Clostridia bacterium]